MDFLRLKIRNFLPVQSADIELTNKGLVLIQGENCDDPSAKSNGGGKSSIPDALCWALWGVTARGISGDAVVNDKAKKDCVVQVSIKDGDTYYEVTRYRKHKEHKNTTTIYGATMKPPSEAEAAHVVTLHKGTEKETQEVIESIVGCSYEVFMAAIYAGQEMMPDLPRMTDKQLKLLIEEAAGVERIEKAYMLARSKAASIEHDLDILNERRKNLTDQSSAAEMRWTQANEKLLEFERDRPTRIASFKEVADKLAAQIRAEHAELLSLNEASIRSELTDIIGKLTTHSELLKRRDSLKANVTTGEKAVARVETEFNRAVAEAKRYVAQLDDAANEMAKPCPECGKPHTPDELEAFKAHLSAKAKEAALKAKAEQEKVNAGKALLAEAVELLQEYERTLPDVSELVRRQTHLNSVLTDIEKRKGSIRLRKKDFDAATARIESAASEANPYESALVAAVKDINSLQDKTAEVEKEIADKTTANEIAKSVVAVFGPAGVRAHILDTVTPFLNDRTADYLSVLSDGNITAVWSTLSSTAKGELREKFNIEVENDKGAKSFAGLSGGEKRKVRLATMMALQDLVASRATKPINIWIGDEIDDALDEAGLERLMTILERKARDHGTVLVISHNELSDWVDQVLTVRKEGGVSTVSGALTF